MSAPASIFGETRASEQAPGSREPWKREGAMIYYNCRLTTTSSGSLALREFFIKIYFDGKLNFTWQRLVNTHYSYTSWGRALQVKSDESCLIIWKCEFFWQYFEFIFCNALSFFNNGLSFHLILLWFLSNVLSARWIHIVTSVDATEFKSKTI